MPPTYFFSDALAIGPAGANVSDAYVSSNFSWVGSSTSRDGSRGALTISGAVHARRAITAGATRAQGLWVYLSVAPSANWFGVLSFWEGAACHVMAGINTARQVEIRRGNLASSPLIAGPSAALPTGAWYYFVPEVTVHDTAGAAAVSVYAATDLVTPLLTLSASSVDTRNGGAAGTIDAVQAGTNTNPGIGTVGYIEEWWAADSVPTAAKKVVIFHPTGDGATNNGVRNTGAGTWASHVDETSPTSDTLATYLTLVNQNDLDLFDVASLPGSSIDAVTVSAIATLSAAGSKTLRLLARDGSGTLSEGSDMTLAVATTAGRHFARFLATAPDGSAWTASAFNACQFGMKRTGPTGSPDIRHYVMAVSVLMDESSTPAPTGRRDRFFVPAC